MALQTKIFNGSTNHSLWTFRIIVDENSTSTSGNSSSVTVTPYIGRNTSASYMKGAEINCIIRVSGCNAQTISGKYTTGTIAAGGWYSLGSRTFTVQHGDDGYRDIEVSASFTNDVNPGSGSASGTMSLTYIPRAATLTSAPNFADEANPTIYYSNPAGNAATVQACIASSDGQVQYVKYRDIPSNGTEYTFDLTDEERRTLIEAVPDGKKELYVSFYIKTIINGNTVTPLKYLTRIFSVVGTEPEIEPVVKDIGSYSVGTLTKDETIMIRGFNHMHATMAVTLKKGATIKSQTIQNGSDTISGSAAEFPSSEDNLFIFTVIDSFGNTVTKEVTIPIVNYITLTCNLITNKPTADGDMTFKIKGNYFNGKFGDNGIDNTLTVKWRYKENNGEYSDWVDVTHNLTGNTYESIVNLTGLNYKSTYTIQTTAMDMINTGGVLSIESKVKTIPVFNWGENNFDIKVPLTVDNVYCTNIFRGSLELGSFDSSTGEKIDNQSQYRNVDFVEVECNESYIFYVNDSTQKIVVLFYDENNTFISETRNVQSDGVFITPDNARYINFRCFQAQFTEDFGNFNIKIKKSSPIKTKTINNNSIYGSGDIPLMSQPVILYDNPSGSNAEIELSDNIDNYEFLEIFFTDNNNRNGGYSKIYLFEGRITDINLSLTEASNNVGDTYIRRSLYYMSENKLTPNYDASGYVYITGTAINTTFHGANLLKIRKILGYTSSGISYINADEVRY